MHQYYKTLNLSPGASKREVQQSYRKLSKRFHPDSNSGEACADTFRTIRMAFEKIQERSFKPKAVPSEELLGQMEYYRRRMAHSARRNPARESIHLAEVEKVEKKLSALSQGKSRLLDKLKRIHVNVVEQLREAKHEREKQKLRDLIAASNRIPESEIGCNT